MTTVVASFASLIRIHPRWLQSMRSLSQSSRCFFTEQSKAPARVHDEIRRRGWVRLLVNRIRQGSRTRAKREAGRNQNAQLLRSQGFAWAIGLSGRRGQSLYDIAGVTDVT